MAEITLNHVYKKYEGGVTAVQDFTLEIPDKEFVIFVGPSGCGKSTTLRMIAGLESISEGELLIDGERMNEVESCNRNIAMVFQSYALYPHMTVFENIAYSMKLKKVPKKEIKERVHEVAQILKIEEILDRKPGQLSGGQKQRVAIARALIHERSILLVDEGTSALDAQNADLVEKSLLANPNLTLILISHHLSDKRKAQFDCVYELMPTSSRA